MKCRCGASFIAYGAEQSTLVGSLFAMPGHDHNNNCLTRRYTCEAGHGTTIALVRRCPACDWTGKRSCGVCNATFVDQWPEVQP